MNEQVRLAIQARLALRNVVKAKCKSIVDTAVDDRCCGTLAYYGAHTGRWGGRGPQPQNWPRASKDMSETPESATTIAELRPHLRRCVYAPGGLVACDLSQIEARALLWFAGDEEGLQLYRDGGDHYVSTAATIYGIDAADVDHAKRATGKLAVLSCGYGGGARALRGIARKQRMTLDVDAVDVVEGYRDSYPLVAGIATGHTYWPDEDDDWTDPVEERRGGLWRDTERAFRSVASGRAAWQDIAGGRAQYRRCGEGVELVLPSGRTIYYRDVRQEPDAKGELKWTYQHPRGRRSVWKGVLVENCWSGDTLVLTRHGWTQIQFVQSDDDVWDGVEWVRTDGAVSRGEQEVVSWEGNRVTPEHTILAGKKWVTVTALDESALQDALELGRASVPWLWWSGVSVRTPWSSSATAEPRSGGGLTPCSASAKRAGSAGTEPRGASEPSTPTSSRTTGSGPCGRIATPGSYRGVTTLTAKRTHATAGGVSESGEGGGTTAERSSSMPSRSPGGTTPSWTSTERTTPKATSRETSAAYPEASTPTTPGARSWLSTGGGDTPTPNGASDSCRSGPGTPPGTTSTGGGARSGSWADTGERTEVWDLLNCGPRHRYVVLTPAGPVIAHNCVQATCRDLLSEAMLRLDAAGYRIVLHVHDEVIVEAGPEHADHIVELMTQLPDWAHGLPVEAEAITGERWLK